MSNHRISKFIDHLLHGFLFYFYANRFAAPRKQLSIVLMVRFVKKFLITLMGNSSYNCLDKLVNDLVSTVTLGNIVELLSPGYRM